VRSLRPGRRRSGASGGSRRPDAVVAEETVRSPRFLANPRARAMFMDPGGTPPSWPCRPAWHGLRRTETLGLPRVVALEVGSHGSFARCLRLADGVTPRPRK